ncbi:MAG TPA: PaaI family thioesterase [Acidimicrobiales bacterium]|nr:PaaI family thioesterase [Acidimicrobiales bacterium]
MTIDPGVPAEAAGRTGQTDAEATGLLRSLMPFTALMGTEAVVAAAGEVRLRLPWAEQLCTASGVLHGGALMALADAAGAWCAFLNLPEGAQTTTIESKTNFLRAARSGYVDAVARPLHVGRTTIVVDTEVRDADGKLVSRSSQTQAVLGTR